MTLKEEKTRIVEKGLLDRGKIRVPAISGLFQPSKSSYGNHGDRNNSSLQLPSGEFAIQQVIDSASNAAEINRIRDDIKTHKVVPTLNRHQKNANIKLPTLKQEHELAGDRMSVKQMIEWTSDCCDEAIEKDLLLYGWKGSLEETTGVVTVDMLPRMLKNGEAINKLLGTSHAPILGVKYYDTKFKQYVVRRLKPHEIGIIGETPKPGQLVQISWRLLGLFHFDGPAFFGEAVVTAKARSKTPDRCFNMNYCAIPNPRSGNYIHLVGMLFIRVISGVGNSVAFTSRGVRGLSLRGQNGNVYPLVNDLMKQQKQQEQERNKQMMKSFLSGNVTPPTESSSDEDIENKQPSDTNENPSKGKGNNACLNDSDNEEEDANLDTRNSPNESKSSYASMNGSTSSSTPLDDSDSDESSDEEEDGEDEENRTTAHINRLLNYINEHGQKFLDKFGVIFVCSSITKNDPYYTDNFFVWFQSEVGINRSNRYRKLRSDEIQILREEGVDLHNADYRARVETARRKEMGQRAAVTAQKRGRFGRKRPAVDVDDDDE